MTLPEQLLLSDLLRRRVRCNQGIDHGAGLQGWMHPPVHRLLGWVSKPSAFGPRRLVWRLNQLRGLTDQEALVQGDPADTDPATLERLPTLFEAALLGGGNQLLGVIADANVELRSGRILDYLVARSDPRLPGSSRWLLSPDRIVDQQPGQVMTTLQGLDDLPLARASVRQELLRRSRRWREQFEEVGGRFEERLEGWLEEPPWQEPDPLEPEVRLEDRPLSRLDEREDWDDPEGWGEPVREDSAPRQRRAARHRSQSHDADPLDPDDPWI
ncbi:RNA methyltransferase [Synechococcus sp. CBW1107]|uniref:RNA methyltransferase n=1 Tax=Synechococcus sp. CBW1107 TaxID=2789857 RepID=UPI0018CF0BB9|nr:RNA methyltransferase [Synechococcus sp. CBW1107]QPN57859.1 RNA methyltransferase [Synechococcus sp. CBW1107]